MLLILKRGDTVRVLPRLRSVIKRPIRDVDYWLLFQDDSGLGDGAMFTADYINTYDSVCIVHGGARCTLDWVKRSPECGQQENGTKHFLV